MEDTPTSQSRPAQDGPRDGDSSGPKRGRRRRKGKGRDGKDRDGNESSERGGDQGRGQREGKRRGPKRDGNRGRKGGGGGDRDRKRGDQPLTAGLFAGVADREMPCRIAGCTKTWTWYGSQQIRSLGKPEPKRMCSEHLAQFEGIEDREMPCRNNWCTRTWTWKRGTQLYQRERNEKLKPPHRLCEQCFQEERGTEDTQIKCKIPECQNTWDWTRQAQLRHRAWVRRQQAKNEAEENEANAEGATPKADAEGPQAEGEAAAPKAEAVEAAAPKAEAVEAAAPEAEAVEAAAPAVETVAAASDGEAAASPAPSEVEAPAEAPAEAEASGSIEAADASPASADEGESAAKQTEASDKVEAKTPSKKRKRRRRRKRKIHDGPPEKLCERCFERLGHLEPIAVPCKVHGCSSTWSWDRDGQLRAWAVLDNREDVTELPQPPRRMCNGCFEFVRGHGDREVNCGRPECEKSWTYKTGAQLQDFLAGRNRDPIRLCEDCTRSQFVVHSSPGVELPAGAEVMPCQVSGCEGSWVWAPGMKLSSSDPDSSEVPVDRMCDDCRGNQGVEARDPRRGVAPAQSSEGLAGDEGAAAEAKAEATDEPGSADEAAPADEAAASEDAGANEAAVADSDESESAEVGSEAGDN